MQNYNISGTCEWVTEQKPAPTYDTLSRPKMLHELMPGEVTSIGDKMYGRCNRCGKIVKNRILFGTLHFCT